MCIAGESDEGFENIDFCIIGEYFEQTFLFSTTSTNKYRSQSFITT